MNFTLQFIPPRFRTELLQKVSSALINGGLLILSEKVALPADIDETLDLLYYDFKRREGYSNEEIERKRKALEGVLIRESRESYVQRLSAAGFSRCFDFMRCYHFTSMAAIKD